MPVVAHTGEVRDGCGDNILTDYFRYLTQQEYIPKNPMAAAPMIKKSNFMASQGKEDLPTFETVTIFTP